MAYQRKHRFKLLPKPCWGCENDSRKGETPTVLRENVTSPNGTTAAGLAALDEYGGGIAISEAIKRQLTVQMK